ncbi:MAG: hypothetical protein RLY71_1361 [Pseudomonadota bacterium]|jgi:hypothetical protein
MSCSNPSGPIVGVPRVRHMRQVLLWPLRLMPCSGDVRRPWERLQSAGSPWQPWVDDAAGAPGHVHERFHERHYSEFVTFLPYVQQFLYGDGRRGTGQVGEPALRVFRRHDIKAVRLQCRRDEAPRELPVVHVNLHFFYDVDVVILEVEVRADELSLIEAQDLLYRLGRAYPSGWDAAGQPLYSMVALDWLDAEGRVLASSDAQQRELYLAHVAQLRLPRIASHWDFLLQPLVPDQPGRDGELRYRQIEYYRMPVMAYLALDEPQALSRSDFVRLGLIAEAARGDDLAPFGEAHLADFEQRHCYDRFWTASGRAPHTRYLCCGHALVVVGRADSDFFRDEQRGVLAQFRHQHLLLFLIAHFQKAALLMYSDRLVEALKDLDIRDPDSVKRFKRAIRGSFEGFLRFTHRYWFHAISEQVQARALFSLSAQHLDIDPLYAEVKERMADMNSYLETDSLRRQANTVVRLTVVTIFGLIGTLTTGFLGMNLLAAADEPMSQRIVVFSAVLIATIWLTVYTMVKSKRLSDFIDALSDERLSARAKLGAFLRIWRTQDGD